MSSNNVNFNPTISQSFYRDSFIDPTTLTPMQNPYKDSKNHSFERDKIMEWLKQKNFCPLGGEHLTFEDLKPNVELKEKIDFLRNQSKNELPHAQNLGEVPEPQKNQQENLEYAAKLIKMGEEEEKNRNYQLAQEIYLDAIKRSSKSEHYKPLANLFALKGETTRAAAAYHVLFNLQQEEGKILEAIESLEKSLSLFPSITIKEKLANTLKSHDYKKEASDHFLELALQSFYSKDYFNGYRYAEEVKQLDPACADGWKLLAHQVEKSSPILMIGAKVEEMPLKDRKNLCKIALLKDPHDKDIQLLEKELKTLSLKNKVEQLKLENSKLETLLKKTTESEKKGPNTPPSSKSENILFTSVASKVPECAFGKQKWEEYFGDVGEEPPLPPNINELLESPCPFFKNLKVKESHNLFLVPKTVNNQEFNFSTLLTLIPKKGEKLKCRTSESFKLHSIKNCSSSYWILITKTVIPGSSRKGCQNPDQYQHFSNLVKTQSLGSHLIYDVPTVLEASASQIVPYSRSQTYSYFQKTATQEKDKHQEIITIGSSGDLTELFIGRFNPIFNLSESARPPGMAAVLRLAQ